MKKILAILLAMILMLALFSACGSEPAVSEATSSDATETDASEETEEPAEAEEVADGYKIGIAFNSFDEYQVEWEKYARAYADELGVELVTTSADAKIEKQVSDIEALLVQDLDAIMVWAIDSEALATSVEKITETDVACIVANYGVNTDQYDLFLYSDQVTTGAMQAEVCIEWVEENPGEVLNVGYLWGVTGISGTIDRYDGWKQNSVDVSENIVLLDEQIGNWSSADAMTITEDWLLAYPEINGIVCQNDEMALGVIQALKAANISMDEFLVLGIDGSETAQLELAENNLDATVFENRRLNAEIEIQSVVDFLDGKIAPEDRDVLIQAKQIMTPENMQEILDDL